MDGGSLEAILHSKKTRYEVLDEILKFHIPEDNLREQFENNVNLFININSVYNTLYNDKTIEIFKTLIQDNTFRIAADLADMCGHYRRYFVTRHRLYVTIYLYYSFEKSQYHLNLDPMYKDEYYRKRLANSDYTKVHDVFMRNLQAFNILAPYLPHVYCIDGGSILEPFVAPEFLIQNFNLQNQYNMILSNDTPDLQYVLKYPYTYVMRIKQQKSILISESIQTELSSSKYLADESKTMLYDMMFERFFNLIIAICGFKSYNIEGALPNNGIVRTVKILEKLNSEGKINFITTDVDLVIEELIKANFLPESSPELIKRNLKLLNASEVFRNLSLADTNKLTSNIIDRVDKEALGTINSKYFARFPVILSNIMYGEDY